MQTSPELLAQLVETRGATEARIAEALSLPEGLIHRIRTRQDCFREEDAERIAEWLELDSLYILACLRAERAKRKGVKTAWSRIALAAISR